MEKQESVNRLPVVQNDKSVSVQAKRFLMVSLDKIKRVGKIMGLSAIAITGMGMIAVSNIPAVVAAGASIFSVAGFRTIQNAILKTEPSLLFAVRKKADELVIEQDLGLGAISKLKNLEKKEKGELMLLQTLVGLSRYKDGLKGKDIITDETGKRVYEQKFSTKTHGINLKTFMALEKLGYIKIDSIEENFKSSLFSNITGKKELKPKNSLLIVEKMGFLEFGEIGKIAKLKLTGKEEELNKYRKQFKKLNFRLTDKQINFEELYEKTNNLENVEDKKERYALQRIGSIFDRRGVLAKKNIDIVKDYFGRDIIKYNAKKNFLTKMSERNLELKTDKREEMIEKLKEGLDLEKFKTARESFINDKLPDVKEQNDQSTDIIRG